MGCCRWAEINGGKNKGWDHLKTHILLERIARTEIKERRLRQKGHGGRE